MLLLAIIGILPIAQAKDIEMVMPGPTNVSQVQFTDRLHGVAMGVRSKDVRGSAIVWTDDGGDNWKEATIQCDVAEAESEALFFVNGQLGWALMCGLKPRKQILLKTEDGGKSWKQQAAARPGKSLGARSDVVRSPGEVRVDQYVLGASPGDRRRRQELEAGRSCPI